MQTDVANPRGHLSLRGLTKRFEGLTAVDHLDLDVAKGELVAFLGPSGCGKSTSLRMIAGLSQATSGTIAIGGRDVTNVPPYRRDIGLVFQSYALFPHMTVLKNVMFGLEMRKVSAAEAERRAREAIALVQLSGREDRRPAQLSGGQQQRVALARALVIQPSILLFDEPLSNLDAKLRDEMRAEIRDIQKRLAITSIFVTHDQVEALSMCDKVAVMNGGRLEQLGTPFELYERPATPFVASFVGRTNRLSGTATGESVDIGGMRLAMPGRHAGPVDIMIRPHRIQMSVTGQGGAGEGAASNRITGTIRSSSYSGDLLQYDVAAEGQVFRIERVTRSIEPPLDNGTPVDLSWQIGDTLVFEAAR
ncbi:ABC transporter ATP-binding protein [Aureimonas endophytica]|uniref:ABC transporter ATP-binding protein n=1 Tax=Aureimonas endophytica TaxID=2027858 RepID=A0A917A0R8_9HYPH|nr:ABC transporter ATP-binding protein [Aureimonas endophytica]GGE21342.1 ABC transporter ATP-binding protein [Aureimonas endophytica]